MTQYLLFGRCIFLLLLGRPFVNQVPDFIHLKQIRKYIVTDKTIDNVN